MAEYRLREEIIARSVSSTWDQAVLEWSLSNICMSDEAQTCLCGHYPIREICTITNSENGMEAEVGNCCVNKFLGLDSEKLFTSIRKVRMDTASSLNRDAIAWAYEKGIISDWDYKFYLNIWRKRNLSQKQSEHKNRINLKVLAHIEK